MADVVPFPGEKVHPNTVAAHEAYAAPEPSEEMVWAVCPWTKRGDETRCHHCPRFELHPIYGQVQRGCFGLAAEVCRVVFVMQKREQA